MHNNSEIETFRILLDGCHDEQTYQEALESNPRLIPREFVQMFWFSVNWKKQVEALRSGRVGFGV
jgi:hypothetical protein